MAHSYIHFRDGILLLRDPEIILLTSLLKERYVVRQESTGKPRSIDTMFARWGSDDFAPGPGCIDLELDTYLCDVPSVRCFVELLDAVEMKLQLYGATIPAYDENTLVGMATYQFGDVKTEWVQGILAKMRNLITSATHN